MSPLPLVLTSIATLAAAHAQTTHVVGPGGFAQITTALAVASPGDVILVHPGSYAAINTSIGVTIRGLASGVSVAGATATLPTTQSLHLVNLSVAVVAVSGGRATLDACVVPGGCTVVSCEASIVASQLGQGFSTSANGLDASSSTITAIDSSFVGRQASLALGTAATEGILLGNATLIGSRLTCHGGLGAQPSGFLGPQSALRSTGSSVVWISDSSLTGGAYVGIGFTQACPVDAQLGRLARCTLVPSSCPLGISTVGPLLGIHQPDPLQSPGSFSLEFTTEPNGLVGVFVSPGFDSFLAPDFAQPVLLDVTAMFPLEVLTANGSGVAAQTWGIPAGLTNFTFFFQAVGTGSPWQLSPLAGGVVR